MIHLQENVALQPIRVPAWAWLLVAFLALAIYAISMENGAVLADGAERVHEFFHDARHFLAVPCH